LGAANGQADATYMFRPDVVATVLDHGALLLDLESKYFYLLNPSGWAMAQLFETGASVDQVVELCRGWGAPEPDLDGVRMTVDQMVSERLIQPTDMNGIDRSLIGEAPATWEPVKLERQAEPLQRVIVSAFDPSIPLAE
jgi:hypothetical protein